MIPLYRRAPATTVAAMMMIVSSTIYGQHLSSARGIALGGFTALSSGMSSLDWNPASLLFVRDWELSTANYVPTTTGRTGLVLHSATLTKRFLGDHAVSLRYSPGKSTEFSVPTTFLFADSNVVVQTEFDQKILYEELYAMGYAYRLTDQLSIGLVGRYVGERVSDVEYFLDPNSIIRSRVVDHTGNALQLDVGSVWMPAGDWRVGLVAKNVLKIAEEQLSENVSRYRLDQPRILRFGAGYSGIPSFVFGLDADTERRFRLGVEWTAVDHDETSSIGKLSFRLGNYFDGRGEQIVEGVGIGVGGVYEFMEFDISYLKFISQENRKGRGDLNLLAASPIQDVEFNPFTGDRISTTLRFYLGRTREAAVRIEGVKVLAEVYPSSSIIHSYTPVAEAYLRNVSGKPVEATASLFIERLMDVPTESKSIRLEPGEQASVLLYAIFNDNIRSVLNASVREAYAYVTTQRAEQHDDRYQLHLFVHRRNDWNGDVNQLKYFVTADDPDVLHFTRSALNHYKDQIDTAHQRMRNFLRARVLFNEFAKRLTYVHDPKKSQDFVQYPSETLSLRGGDCDDMTICFASLLSSIGVSSAFIDVISPENPAKAHIYMMFDSGVETEYAHLISENPKRFVVRKNSLGKETIWIPIETTVITQGFEEAWDVGAKEYYDDVEIGLGLAKGWVKIVDVRTVY